MVRRLLILATLLASATTTTTWAQRPLKVYISADMEGITGVASADHCRPRASSIRKRANG
jgi:hypothetical protein